LDKLSHRRLGLPKPAAAGPAKTSSGWACQNQRRLGLLKPAVVEPVETTCSLLFHQLRRIQPKRDRPIVHQGNGHMRLKNTLLHGNALFG
jgi:hypothetical protein